MVAGLAERGDFRESGSEGPGRVRALEHARDTVRSRARTVRACLLNKPLLEEAPRWKTPLQRQWSKNNTGQSRGAGRWREEAEKY